MWLGASGGRPPSPDVIRPILRYGATALHQPATPVEAVTPEVLALVDDMVQTMYAAPGVGLAGTGRRARPGPHRRAP